MTAIKICCITSPQEAALAIDAGANIVGLVGEMPTGPGTIDDDSIAEIARQVKPPIETFVLSSRTDADDLYEHVTSTGTTSIQVVRHVDPAAYATLIDRVPNIKRVQVIHITDRSVLQLIDRYAAVVDYFLLDSGLTATDEYGGTGRVHDWEISAEFVQKSPLPVFLAGGLNSENVCGAIETVKPYGVDVCSGVRTDGVLDEQKVAAFIKSVKNASIT